MKNEVALVSKPHRLTHSNASHAEKSSQITPAFILESLRRWWHVCFPVSMVLTAIACFAIWLSFEPVYQSKSVIRIEDTQLKVLDEAKQDRSRRDYVKNELALIRSPLILTRVLREERVLSIPEVKEANDKEKALVRLVNVQSASGEIHYITCNASSPKNAKILCDAVSDSYFKYRTTYEDKMMSELMSLLEDERQESEKVVKSVEDKLKEVVQRSQADLEMRIERQTDENGGEFSSQPVVKTPLLQLQMTFESELFRYQDLKAEIAHLEKMKIEPFEIDERKLQLAIENDTRVRELTIAIGNEKRVLEDSELGPDHPTNRRLSDQIARKEVELDEATGFARSNGIELLTVQAEEEIESELDEKNRELQRVDARLNSLNEKIEEQSELLSDANKEALSIEFLREDLMHAKQIRDRLRERAMLLATEKMAPERVVRANDEASLPIAPIEAVPFKQLALVSVLTFSFPFFIALLWELRVRRVSNSEQLEQSVDRRLVGEVAVLPTRGKRGASSSKRVERQFRLFEESVDSLRTFFTLSADEKNKVIAITSAVPNEGKTTIASQLAISLGRASREPVLLIDADLRAPDIHFIFGFDNEVGLIDVLCGEASLDEAIQSVMDDNLMVLPAGELAGLSPHQVIDPERMASLVEELRERYAYVVFDTSPILSTSESLHVARNCDATIACVMRDVSRLEQVKKVAKRLDAAGINLEGLVLSGVPQYKYSYSYGVYGDYAKK